MSASENVERLLLVAKSSYSAARECLALIVVLSAGNHDDLQKSISSAGAGLTSATITKALFARLLMGVMVSYDEPRKGDLHLRVAMDILRDPDTRALVLAPAATIECELAAAEDGWNTCQAHPALKRLRMVRNKEAAHISGMPPDVPRPAIADLLDLAKRTAAVSEKLASALGVTRVSLAAQTEHHARAAKIFWEKWGTKEGGRS